MQSQLIVFLIFLIFTGAALLATVALFARQSLLVAYILLGVMLGPWGLRVVTDSSLVTEMSHVGIIFLLFLLGLDLHPQQLLHMLRNATLVTTATSLLFGLLGGVFGWVLEFTLSESMLIGAALMFSSTIIGLKLLPTTVLHHQHTGEIIISVLLLQDLMAIVVLLLLEGLGQGAVPLSEIIWRALALPGLILFALVFDRYVLVRLLRRFDTIREYVFLTAIGWCLGIAQLAYVVGLSYEIGAFIAGVSLATSPIAMYIAESLKPLRDFFLVMFFFSLGASFNLEMLKGLLLPALLLAALILFIKPWTFKMLLQHTGEAPKRAWEVGVRLGQISEFSLLITFMAIEKGFIGHRASSLIQLTTLLTFIASSYFIVKRFPTPIAVSDRLRRD
jgi:Kef-type K+ transport system, predicted NAD-binding component